MLFNHSVRVFAFGALRRIRQNLKFDSELLYIAALFHDLGLVHPLTVGSVEDLQAMVDDRTRSIAITTKSSSRNQSFQRCLFSARNVGANLYGRGHGGLKSRSSALSIPFRVSGASGSKPSIISP